MQPGYDVNVLTENDTTRLYAPQVTEIGDKEIELYCERCNFEVRLLEVKVSLRLLHNVPILISLEAC